MLFQAHVSEFVFLILCATTLLFIVNSELHLNENKSAKNDELLNTFLDNFHKRFEFMEFCRDSNLNVSVNTDSKIYSIEVSFMVSALVFKDCYEYYKIILKKQKKMVDHAQVRYRYDVQGGVSHKFQNVTCGIYEITFHPCYNDWQCSPRIIKYPESINMTSNDCLGLNVRSTLKVVQKFGKKMIVIIAVSSALLILAISGLIFCNYWSTKPKCKQRNVTSEISCNNGTDIVLGRLLDVSEDRSPTRNIAVYIFHYYDRQEVNKWKVQIIKDFYLKSSFYNIVRTIEDELSVILFDVNDWLNKMLEERTEDGNIRKIILIASGEDNQEDEYELENVIFSEFIDKLNDNIEQCLRGYDHLFVAQLIKNTNYPEKLENIVRRVRYSLSEELIDDHLINLSLNLCSGSNLDESVVEKKLRDLLSEHPVRYLGSIL